MSFSGADVFDLLVLSFVSRRRMELSAWSRIFEP